MFRLVVLSKEGAAKLVFDLPEKDGCVFPSILFGSHEKCDVRILQTHVSEEHATLSLHSDGVWRLHDISEPRHGTLVNTARMLRLTDVELSNGDMFQIGPKKIRFEQVIKPKKIAAKKEKRSWRGPNAPKQIITRRHGARK